MTFKELIADEKPILIDFYADWCGPCKAMSPILKEVSKEMGEKARIVKINVDKNPQLSQQLKVQSIPTLMIYKNGKLEWRHTGIKTAPDLVNRLKQMA